MFFFIFCFYIISLVNCSIELELKHSMMTNYSKTIIPKADPLDLTMGIAFRAFNSIDHIESVITSNIWLRHYWRDNRLVWVPNEWGSRLMKQVKPKLTYIVLLDVDVVNDGLDKPGRGGKPKRYLVAAPRTLHLYASASRCPLSFLHHAASPI